jgi:hypothetical protein
MSYVNRLSLRSKMKAKTGQPFKHQFFLNYKTKKRNSLAALQSVNHFREIVNEAAARWSSNSY